MAQTLVNFVTGQITAANGTIPENIRPAPGVLGAVTIVNNSASNSATLTAPGSGGFVLAPSQAVSLILGDVKLTVTGTSPLVSYAYATNGA